MARAQSPDRAPLEASSAMQSSSSSSKPLAPEVEKPPAVLQSSRSSRFKVLGWAIMALRRWQNAMNPTITFGKPGLQDQEPGAPNTVPLLKVASTRYTMPDRPQSARRLSLQAHGSGRASSGPTASGKPRSLSGRPTSAGKQHGHKGMLLFKPLPEPETVV